MPYVGTADGGRLYGLVYAVAVVGAVSWLIVLRAVRSHRRSANVLALMTAVITASLAALLFASTEYGTPIFPPLWGTLASLPPLRSVDTRTKHLRPLVVLT